MITVDQRVTNFVHPATTWSTVVGVFHKLDRQRFFLTSAYRFGERGFSYCGPAAWNFLPTSTTLLTAVHSDKKLSYRRGTARCVVSVEILPITTQQCRNYLYDKS